MKLAIVKQLERAVLFGNTECNVFCYSILPSEDDNTLFFVDYAHNALKRVAIQNASDAHVVYRCESPVRLCAALFVQFAPQQKALLVAERLPDSAAQSMSHSLSVALCDATRWTHRQRVPLETATCKLNDAYSFCIGTVHTNKVLCGVWSTSSLEALAVDATGTARLLQPIPLGFSYLYFETGHSQGTELLFINICEWPEIRILQVVDVESLSLQLLRVIESCGAKLLWHNGLLFATTYHVQTESHEVSVWRVSGGGQNVVRCGTPIAHAENMSIHCWSAMGEKIALWDLKSENIFVYELKY